MKVKDVLKQADPPAAAPAALEQRMQGQAQQPQTDGTTGPSQDALTEAHGKKRFDFTIHRLEQLVVRMFWYASQAQPLKAAAHAIMHVYSVPPCK